MTAANRDAVDASIMSHELEEGDPTMRGTATVGKALSRAELKLLADGLTWLLGIGRGDALETRRRAGRGAAAGAPDSQTHKVRLGRRRLRGGAQK
jgi:hypothetical protein